MIARLQLTAAADQLGGSRPDAHIAPMRESLTRLFDRRRVLVCTLAGAVLGMAIALQGLSPAFIAGTGGKWVRPENDYIAYLVAWNYFIVDEWRLPLFELPAMGYPEGGSVLFNDALPATALPTKVLYKLTGMRVNPFGWWIFLTYILQGAMAARLVCAVGVRSVWACLAAATFAVVCTSFASRMGHTALSSHFLLLWALALYFESVRRSRLKAIEFSLLLAAAVLINSYLFAMVFGFLLVTIAALWFRRQLTRRDLQVAGAGVAVVVVIAVTAGYGVFLVSPSTMKSEGFGLYSWNLAGLLVPPAGVFGQFAGIARDATHGQYEGEAYLGHGALVVLLLCVLFTPRRVVQHLRTHAIYVAALLGFAAYAASNKVYFGSTLLAEYPLPQFALDLGNYFRATGRFIWPLSYSLAILPVACIFRWWHPAPAIAVVVLGVSLQIQDEWPKLEYRARLTAQPYEDLVDTARLNSWLSQHDRLWQYPSWACGGLGGSKRSWGNKESNRELQVQLAAARAGLPTNSVYTSRLLKHCPTEFTWLNNPQLEDGVLYLLGPEAVAASPTLTTLARSNACVTLDWVVACSRKWSRMAEAAELGAPSRRK